MDATGTDRNGEYLAKIRFYHIAANRFDWQREKSDDHGKTWHIADEIHSKRKLVKGH